MWGQWGRGVSCSPWRLTRPRQDDVGELLPVRVLFLHQKCPRDSMGQCQPAWGEDFWGEDLG